MKTSDLHRAEPRHDTIKAHHIEQHRHDPYKARPKLRKPMACPQCGAVFVEGRWQWLEKLPKEAGQEICPACHRSNDKYPAGEIILSGAFAEAHRTEIFSLIRNTQEQQNAEHPLSRIIDVSGADGTTVVTTTDIHCPTSARVSQI